MNSHWVCRRCIGHDDFEEYTVGLCGLAECEVCGGRLCRPEIACVSESVFRNSRLRAMAEGNFENVESFGIDNGELGGLTPQECFVFGCEYTSVMRTVDENPEMLSFTVHSANKDRLEAALSRRGRKFRFSSINEAMKEAERVCRTFKVDVRVVRVIGTFVPESRWISNVVPGYA